MKVKIIDTTLRDGEQRAGIALSMEEKIKIAKLLDKMGVYQIEAGIPAMGGEEKSSIKKIVKLGLKSKISAWNRINIGDIIHSLDCGVELIHISVPSSDIQIKYKLGKDRNWIIDYMKKCIAFAKNNGANVTIGLEDASRADPQFIMRLVANAFLEGVTRVRYADTVGILYRKKIYDEIRKIKSELNVDVEIHSHNDLGMAVANSVSAVMGGADFVDCTVAGIGERAGNCDLIEFIKAARFHLGTFEDVRISQMLEIQKDILKIIEHKSKAS
ncbi:MAG TPA: homocitrate synthase [Clostridia bacterium]|nr:homocitrate synthase [Clostridia bacterium]